MMTSENEKPPELIAMTGFLAGLFPVLDRPWKIGYVICGACEQGFAIMDRQYLGDEPVSCPACNHFYPAPALGGGGEA